MENKIYLGDGAYAEFDGFGFIITAEDGIRATNTVYLEPDCLEKLIKFRDKIKL